MNANIVGIDNTSGIIHTMFETYGHYEEGMYWVGYHIPSGDYRLVAVEDAPLSFYSLFYDTLQIATTVNIDANEYIYITLEKGQYIKLVGAKMIPVE